MTPPPRPWFQKSITGHRSSKSTFGKNKKRGKKGGKSIQQRWVSECDSLFNASCRLPPRIGILCDTEAGRKLKLVGSGKNLLCFPSILGKNSFPWKLNTFYCVQIRKWNNSVSRLSLNTQCQHFMKRKIFICKCSNEDIIKDLSIWISLQTTVNLSSVKSADVYFGRESIRETYFRERKNPQKPK